MSDVAGAKIIAEITAGRIAPVYYLYGEAFARDRVVTALRQAVAGDDPHGMQTELLEAKESGARGILAAARTMPMFGGRRLVIVRAAHVLATNELNALIPYLGKPATHAVVVFVADKAELRAKFFTALKRAGVLARFEPLKERQAPAWVAEQARHEAIRLGPGAAERIAQAVGTDMSQLVSALERLSLYVGSDAVVSVEVVEEVLAETRERSIFELTNAVGRGKRREALLVLRQMLQAREPAVRIVAMLARHVRQLWSARELAAAGRSREALASELGIAPFFVADVVSQARRFEESKLAQMHHALVEADMQLKSSRLPDALILERLVLGLC